MLSLGLFTLALASSMGLAAAATSGAMHSDPGPSPECPEDMRLVWGEHHDEVQHLCLDPRRDAKDTHCFAYAEGVTALEGERTSIRVCMDRFEAPNQAGAKPMVMRSYESGRRWCEKRGKRMCTEAEWETACEGPEQLPYAYGWAVARSVCNSDKQWKPVDFARFGKDPEQAAAESDRLWQGSPSGRYAGCVSPFGIGDMMGNVEEWVTSRRGRKHPGALMGGFWAKPWTGCRGTNDAHEPTFAFYETGFRCCAEPRAPSAPKETH
jgi:sulfatase modifying factor 1